MHIYVKCGIVNKGIDRRPKKQTSLPIAVHFIDLLYNGANTKKFAVNQFPIPTFTPCSL
jgi:hypothetical protein